MLFILFLMGTLFDEKNSKKRKKERKNDKCVRHPAVLVCLERTKCRNQIHILPLDSDNDKGLGFLKTRDRF